MVAISRATIHPEEAGPMAQQMSVLGIDIAKLVFHVVGMEACGSAHYWARHFREHGHDVRLIAPQFVKAYVKSPKHDAHDAEAICEAVTRPTMRFVPIKRIEQ